MHNMYLMNGFTKTISRIGREQEKALYHTILFHPDWVSSGIIAKLYPMYKVEAIERTRQGRGNR